MQDWTYFTSFGDTLLKPAPLCMNCKHFSQAVESVGFSRPFRVNVFRCLRKGNGARSLVTGTPLKKPPTCTGERETTFIDRVLSRDKCGIAGRYFEGTKQ